MKTRLLKRLPAMVLALVMALGLCSAPLHAAIRLGSNASSAEDAFTLEDALALAVSRGHVDKDSGNKLVYELIYSIYLSVEEKAVMMRSLIDDAERRRALTNELRIPPLELFYICNFYEHHAEYNYEHLMYDDRDVTDVILEALEEGLFPDIDMLIINMREEANDAGDIEKADILAGMFIDVYNIVARETFGTQWLRLAYHIDGDPDAQDSFIFYADYTGEWIFMDSVSSFTYETTDDFVYIVTAENSKLELVIMEDGNLLWERYGDVYILEE